MLKNWRYYNKYALLQINLSSWVRCCLLHHVFMRNLVGKTSKYLSDGCFLLCQWRDCYYFSSYQRIRLTTTPGKSSTNVCLRGIKPTFSQRVLFIKWRSWSWKCNSSQHFGGWRILRDGSETGMELSRGGGPHLRLSEARQSQSRWHCPMARTERLRAATKKRGS